MGGDAAAADPFAEAPELKFTVEKSPAGTVVNCFGRITFNTVDLLVEKVRPLIPEANRIVLDLTQVSFMDSSGLGTMVRLWVTAKNAGCEFKARNLSQRLKDLFTMTNLASMFGEG